MSRPRYTCQTCGLVTTFGGYPQALLHESVSHRLTGGPIAEAPVTTKNLGGFTS